MSKKADKFFKESIENIRIAPPKKVGRKILLIVLLGKFLANSWKMIVGSTAVVGVVGAVIFSQIDGDGSNSAHSNDNAIDTANSEKTGTVSSTKHHRINSNDATTAKSNKENNGETAFDSINGELAEQRTIKAGAQKNSNLKNFDLQGDKVLNTERSRKDGKTSNETLSTSSKKTNIQSSSNDKNEINNSIKSKAQNTSSADKNKNASKTSAAPDLEKAKPENLQNSTAINSKDSIDLKGSIDSNLKDAANKVNGSLEHEIAPGDSSNHLITETDNSNIMDKGEALSVNKKQVLPSEILNFTQDSISKANKTALDTADRKVPADSIIVNNIASKDSTLNDSTTNAIEEQKDQESKSPVFFEIAPLFSMDQMTKNSPVVKYDPLFSLGITSRVNYKKYFLDVGAHYSTQRLQYIETNQLDSTLTNYSNYYQIDSTTSMDIKVDTMQVDTVTVLTMDTTYTTKYDSTLVTDSTVTTVKYSEMQEIISKLRYVRIPLYFGRKFTFNNHEVSVGLGDSVNVLANKKTVESGIPVNSALQLKPINLDIRASVGYGYKVNSWGTIFGDIWYTRMNGSPFKNTTIQYETVGLAVGLRIKL